MDANEINRLACMGSALRPDWPTRSLKTFIERNLESRTYADVAVALAWICTHTKTDTPRLLLEAGAWWKATATDAGTSIRHPKRDEACETCGRRASDHGGPILGDHPFAPLHEAKRNRTSDGIADVRAALRTTGADRAETSETDQHKGEK